MVHDIIIYQINHFLNCYLKHIRINFYFINNIHSIHIPAISIGTAEKWLNYGIEYVAFFQDTNGLCFYTLAATLGVTLSLDLYVNSLTIPRKAKQAVGAITRLTKTESSPSSTTTNAATTAETATTDASNTALTDVPTRTTATAADSEELTEMTINVEYNQLDPLLRASTTYSNGDTNDPTTGYSPFPGNINQLIFKLQPYLNTLKHTNGVISEFVNPKYTDDTKTLFKKPTRLECMMQDYPKSLKNEDAKKVGFTMFPTWLCYSPCKNNIVDAAISIKNDIPAGCAYTAESDQYQLPVKLLQNLGCHIENETQKSYSDITAVPGPRVVFHPSFSVFPSELKTRFPTPENVFISKTSTLIIKGDVIVYSLRLNGALKLTASPGTKLYVYSENDYEIVNAGYQMISLTELSSQEYRQVSEIDLMRGYIIKKTTIEDINTESVMPESMITSAISTVTNTTNTIIEETKDALETIPLVSSSFATLVESVVPTSTTEFVYNSKQIILKSAYIPSMETSYNKSIDMTSNTREECSCFGIKLY